MFARERTEIMPAAAFISSLLSYIFTTIIFLFIISIIRLIYMDIRRIDTDEADNEEEE